MPQSKKGSYTVTHQEQSVEYGADGHPQKVWTVSLEHPEGVTSKVTVPDQNYTAANVHALAQEQADRVASVAALPEGAPEQ